MSWALKELSESLRRKGKVGNSRALRKENCPAFQEAREGRGFWCGSSRAVLGSWKSGPAAASAHRS